MRIPFHPRYTALCVPVIPCILRNGSIGTNARRGQVALFVISFLSEPIAAAGIVKVGRIGREIKNIYIKKINKNKMK